jgi:hypothetical protein
MRLHPQPVQRRRIASHSHCFARDYSPVRPLHWPLSRCCARVMRGISREPLRVRSQICANACAAGKTDDNVCFNGQSGQELEWPIVTTAKRDEQRAGRADGCPSVRPGNQRVYSET